MGQTVFQARSDLRVTLSVEICRLTPSILEALANSQDPDEMSQNAVFHLGLHCLPRKNTSLHIYFEISTCGPLKCAMKNHIIIVLSIRENQSEYKGLMNKQLTFWTETKNNPVGETTFILGCPSFKGRQGGCKVNG